MTENFVAIRVHAGDGVALDGHLRHAAQIVAVKPHTVGISFVSVDGFLTIQVAGAHIQQIGNGVLGGFFAHQRGDVVQPRVVILFFGQNGEQLHEGALNLAEKISVFSRRNRAEAEQAYQRKQQRKPFFHDGRTSFNKVSLI